ncbi:anti-sigma factor [Nocardioides convexus]|uniref:anti-sigma factor n=1 Tax=Nocardioides convexus TaxID=2712224 RepID=UPI0024188146|nr:anti-sigma factor [Nocardioides convexus]
MTDHDHALSGAYAVDALDAEERARFEAHLHDCRDCQEEVASLREAAALLGTDSAEPPAAVRDAVLASIQSIRPLPPVVETAETPASTVSTTDEPRRAPCPPGPGAPADPHPAARGRRRGPAARRRHRLPAAVDQRPDPAGACRPRRSRCSPRPTRPGSRRSSRTARGRPSWSPAARARRSSRPGTWRPPRAARPTSLWLQSPAGEMVPAGVMPKQSDTTFVLDGDASKATGVGITVEPAGGSDHPTTQPIALFPLET